MKGKRPQWARKGRNNEDDCYIQPKGRVWEDTDHF